MTEARRCAEGHACPEGPGGVCCGNPAINLVIPVDLAEEIQLGLSDMACWVRGYMAGCPDELDRHPLGIDELRAINIKLKRAIGEARK